MVQLANRPLRSQSSTPSNLPVLPWPRSISSTPPPSPLGPRDRLAGSQRSTPRSVPPWSAPSTTPPHRPPPQPPRWTACRPRQGWPPKPHAFAHRAVWVASELVLLDEAQSTLAPLAKAIAAAFAEKRKIDAARQAILAELRSDDEAHREIFVGLGAFDRARHDAESVPHTPDTNEFHGEWRALAASLLQSPEAALGDAPVTPLPAYQHIALPDPVVAAAAAAASFPTTSVMTVKPCTNFQTPEIRMNSAQGSGDLPL